MWIITAWQHISPEITIEGFKKCFISIAMDQTDDTLWYGSEEDGNVRTVRKMKALTEDADSDSDR
jgi:hypothetical protein